MRCLKHLSFQMKGYIMQTIGRIRLALLVALALTAPPLRANDGKGSEGKGNDGKGKGKGREQGLCEGLPSHDQLQAALKSVVDVGGTNNSGFGLNMWASTVNRDGEVCAVAFTGEDRGDQ